MGVQSNQFPRALDRARQFRAADIPVVIGGFHVSGCLAMLDDMQADVQAALDLGCILFAGEAEGRMADVMRDIAAGTAKPIYNYLDDLPDLANATLPLLPRDVITRVINQYTSFDAGRGCPFQCSFCTIINVQGRKSRRRTPDDIEQIVRANATQGITRFFVTDDNFARNRDWEPMLDRLIALRQEGHEDQADPAGRHAVPQDSRLRGEGGEGRMQQRLHRAGEHQSRGADRGEEAAEPHLGISRDAAGVEARAGDDLCGLHHRLPERHARIRSSETSRRSSASCRSICSSS